jgi:hypothetical protein
MANQNQPVSPGGGPGAVLALEFQPEAAPSDFEVDRAIAAYIPLLEACYDKANQRPVAFPDGYESLAEIRASITELTEAAAADPPAVRAAVQNDVAAAEEAVADPGSFGFVVREQATGAALICIRGTQTPREWLANFTAVPTPFRLVPGFGQVHLGFQRMHQSVRDSIATGLNAVPAATRVTVLGHSLGGAMAILAAVDLKRNYGRASVDVCTVGGPRTGKIDFRRSFNAEIARCYRLTNQFDIVPHVPTFITGWNHVGEEIEVDGNVQNPHSLDAYLKGLRNIGRPREITASGEAIEAVVAGAVSVRMP